MRPTAEDVAVMLVAMVRRVAGKRGEGSRWRISVKTMRKVGKRAMLRDAFIGDVEEELAQLGYTLFLLPAGGYGLIETSAFDSWPAVSTRDRLEAELKALAAGDKKGFDKLIEDARTQYTPPEDAEDDG